MFKVRCEHCGNDTFELITFYEDPNSNKDPLRVLKCKHCNEINDMEKLTYMVNEINKTKENISITLDKLVDNIANFNDMDDIKNNLDNLNLKFQEYSTNFCKYE